MSRNPLTTETSLVGLGSAVLAAVLTWPIVRHPIRSLPADTYDPALQAWQVAWTGHALRHHPFSLWTTNATFPEHLTLAFSDSLLGFAPFGLLGSGPAAAVFRYNVLFVLSFAVASLGMYALVRQLGAGRAAAVVVAVAFAYSPWRFAHAGHLNILSSGGIPLALAMLARGHDWSLQPGRLRENIRPSWAFAGWLTAAGQVSLGFGLGVPFVYVLAGITLLTAIRRLRPDRPTLPARLLRADLAGGAVFLLITAALAHPYLRVLAEHPDARRDIGWLNLMSPPWRGFFLAGEHSWLWGSAQTGARDKLGFAGEMELLPGFTLMLLAGVGLVRSVWSRRTRAALALGVVGSAWLALGTAAPGHGRYGYLLLYRFLPGFDGSRTPGRLVLWTILLLGLLAAGALTTKSPAQPPPERPEPLGLRAVTPRPPESGTAVLTLDRPARTAAAPAPKGRSRLRPLMLTLALIGVLTEGINGTPQAVVPKAPISLAGLAAPILVLPTDELADLHVMLWSTDTFPTLVNGSSGYNPPSRQKLREAMTSFPDQHSVSVLRGLGVKTVLVLPEAVGTPYEAALGRTGRRFGIDRTDQNGVAVFTL